MTYQNYRTKTRSKHIKDLIFCALKDIGISNFFEIEKTFKEIIGKKFSNMVKVSYFKNNTLYVKVNSSSLYSVLSLYEKERILKKLQEKFSKKSIKNIEFKIG